MKVLMRLVMIFLFQKGRKIYFKKFKKQSLKAAKNGTYFLPKGAYTVKIESSTEVFEIQ